jgi:hypothetical protein
MNDSDWSAHPKSASAGCTCLQQRYKMRKDTQEKEAQGIEINKIEAHRSLLRDPLPTTLTSRTFPPFLARRVSMSHACRTGSLL